MPQPKSERGYRLGIVNPLTLVGNEIKTILHDRAFPFDRIALLSSTEEGTGALTDVEDEPRFVAPVSDAELEDLDLVFFCGSPAANAPWIAKQKADGFIAIDLSRPAAIEDAKLAVAGINLENIDESDRVIVSPHPIAIPLALILHQIESIVPIEFCTATVVQPASEFEQAGVEELAQQTISVLNIHSVPKEIFDRQLAFNLYPALERNEEFITKQVKELIDPRTELAMLVTQGTIFHGHTFSLFVKTKSEVTTDRILEALRSSAAIALPEGDESIGTIDAAGKDEVLIGDVRQDPSIRGGFWVWAVCDNLRRSSALNAVLVAEKVLFGSAVN